MLEAARDGIVDRGKATVGDKAMLDALAPPSIPPLARNARAQGARQPPWRARVGHQDAGVTSAALLLDTVLRALDPAPSAGGASGSR